MISKPYKIGDKWYYANDNEREGPFTTRDEAAMMAEKARVEQLKEEKRKTKEAKEKAKEAEWEKE